MIELTAPLKFASRELPTGSRLTVSRVYTDWVTTVEGYAIPRRIARLLP